MNGLLLIDKSAGWTSHDVVQKMRGVLGVRKIGHAGTLDPAAEGLLILLIGSATKFQGTLQGHDKDYQGRIRLGTRTRTADAEGEVIETRPVPELECETVRMAAKRLEGDQEQVPPDFSAVKVQGKPAYYWARKNKTVQLKARPISVQAFHISSYAQGCIHFELSCSSGTYVRTLAEQLAAELDTVGHLEYLRRTRVGAWSVTGAVGMQWVVQSSREDVAARIVPVPDVLHSAEQNDV